MARATFEAAFWIASPSAPPAAPPSCSSSAASACALDLVGRAEDLRRLHEIVEVADRVADQPVELGMRLRASRPAHSAR